MSILAMIVHVAPLGLAYGGAASALIGLPAALEYMHMRKQANPATAPATHAEALAA